MSVSAKTEIVFLSLEVRPRPKIVIRWPSSQLLYIFRGGVGKSILLATASRVVGLLTKSSRRISLKHRDVPNPERSSPAFRNVETIAPNLRFLMNGLFKAFASTIGITLIVVASSLSSSTFAQPQPGPTPCFDCSETSTEYPNCESASRDEQSAEQKVRDQVLKGSRKRLDEGSVIRGCFVRDLLTKGPGVSEMGIVIDGA